MTITFENDSDVIVYALEKIISYASNTQYLFVANCIWWIAGIIGLDDGLRIHIHNLTSRERILRGVSSTPRDIARNIRLDLDKQALSSSANYVSDPSRRTWKGRVNPLPKSKKQLKKARQAEARRIVLQAKSNIRLANIREKIISNLRQKGSTAVLVPILGT